MDIDKHESLTGDQAGLFWVLSEMVHMTGQVWFPDSAFKTAPWPKRLMAMDCCGRDFGKIG